MTAQVSVIIAAWRASRTLRHAVASALAQSGVEVEVIIADDASGDDTFAVAQELADADPRVRAFRQAANAGPAAARNLALSRATAPWVAVLDADDLMRPDRLSSMLALAERTGADVLLGNMTEVSGRSDAAGLPDGGPRFIASPEEPEEWSLPHYIRGNFEMAGGRTLGYLKPMIRRAFLERHEIRYDEKLRNGEDHHLILACYAAGARVWFSAAPDYLYFRHDASVSHRADPAHLRAVAEADRQFARRQTDPAIRALMERRIAQIEQLGHAETIMAALRDRKPKRAAAHLLRNPDALPRLVRQLGEALRKRL